MDTLGPKVSALSADRLGPLVAGLCLAVPNVLFRYPAMVDLPLHEGVVGLLRHFGDPTIVPPGVYVLNFGHGNQLFYVLSWLLSYVCGVDMACKIVIAATLCAIPVLGGRLAASIGASRWVGLLLAPVAIGWMYLWGVIGNLMGIAALLAALPTLDRLAERPSWRRVLEALGFVVLLYETHELMLILYAGAALIFAAGQPLRWKETLLRVLPFFAGLVILVVEHLWTARIATPLVTTGLVTWAPIGRKFIVVPGVLFGGHEPANLYGITALSALAIVLLVIARARGQSEPIPRAPMAFIHRYRFELFGVACFALYIALPANVHGATLVYHRFVAPAYAILAVCCGPRGAGAGPSRITRIVLAAVPVAALFVLFPLIADVSTSAGDVDKLLALVKPGSAVAQIDLGPNSEQMRNSAIGSVGARALALRGGRLLFSLMVSPISPVLFAKGEQWNEPIRRTFYDHYAFCPSYDFTRFRYMLLHTTSGRLALGVALAMAPDARMLETAGDWVLFESTMPVASVTSKDARFPSPAPESLRSTIKRLTEQSDAPLQDSELPAEADPNRTLGGPGGLGRETKVP